MKIIKRIIGIVVLATIAHNPVHAQIETPSIDSSNLEWLAIQQAFDDSTNTDTLRFTQQNLSSPNDFVANTILNSQDVLDLIDNYHFATDSLDTNVVFEMYTSFTLNNISYSKTYSYGVVRKNFNYTSLDNVLTPGLKCINITEKITITNPNTSFPIQVTNNYYVVYNLSVVQYIAAYHEMAFEPYIIRRKYLDINPIANRSSLGIPSVSQNTNYLTVAPNPATSTIAIKTMSSTATDADIIISDVTGRKVKTIKCGKLEANVDHTYTEDVSTLVPGMYTITLRTPAINKTIKVIISK
jgi:hypothetical protein